MLPGKGLPRKLLRYVYVLLAASCDSRRDLSKDDLPMRDVFVYSTGVAIHSSPIKNFPGK